MAHSPRRFANPDDLTAYVDKLLRPDRAGWQKPDEVLAALGLGEADIVADVGAGPGYFSLPLSQRAAHVFAVEVEPKLLAVLLERVRAAAVRNLTPILALPEDPLLPAESCDRVLIVDAAHHFRDRKDYLRRVAGALRPRGQIACIDFHRRETPVGPALEHRVAREELLADAVRAGLRLAAEHTFLPHQYFLILERAPSAREENR